MVDIFGFELNLLTTIAWLAMKVGTSIHVPLRMDSHNFVDPLTFHAAPPSG